MKENGFYGILALVSLLGLLVLGLLIYKASKLPNYYPTKENISTKSNFPTGSPSPQPASPSNLTP